MNQELTLSSLANHIYTTHTWFSEQAARQINTSLTIRNWVIGLYIREYEQRGADRAQYGAKLLLNLLKKLREKGMTGLTDRYLRWCRSFYETYPQIWMTLSSKFQSIDNQGIKSLFLFNQDNESVLIPDIPNVSDVPFNDPDLLVNRLSFSHFLELLKCDTPIQRVFYEFNESDLEQAIINHLQKFLMELGRGFCFEARQRRITFGNKHYRIDLVFYHRILKCHVLIDLKMGEFDHSDAGQMNLYLNYFLENEMTEGDNPPVGVILCAQKDEALVHYATGNLSPSIFVSKYLVNLPTEEQLMQIVREEQKRLEK